MTFCVRLSLRACFWYSFTLQCALGLLSLLQLHLTTVFSSKKNHYSHLSECDLGQTWWLLILSLFPCVCWPSLPLIWRNGVVLSFCSSVVRILCLGYLTLARAAVHGVAKSWTRLGDFTFTHWRRKWQPTPVFLPGESQGQGSLVDCCLWCRTELDMTELT